MMPPFAIGTMVFTAEHPYSVGEVKRANGAGDLTIKFTTPPRNNRLAYCITEVWPVSDQDSLVPWILADKLPHFITEKEWRNDMQYWHCTCGLVLGPFHNSESAADMWDQHASGVYTASAQ
jgi:hypothetical protein